MQYISRLDEILLISVWRLKDDAYAIPIIQEMKKRTGKILSPGALWVSLDNLAKKGYLEKTLAESTPEIGGRGKLYYHLTPAGFEALNAVSELHTVLWGDIGNTVTERSGGRYGQSQYHHPRSSAADHPV